MYVCGFCVSVRVVCVCACWLTLFRPIWALCMSAFGSMQAPSAHCVVHACFGSSNLVLSFSGVAFVHSKTLLEISINTPFKEKNIQTYLYILPSPRKKITTVSELYRKMNKKKWNLRAKQHDTTEDTANTRRRKTWVVIVSEHTRLGLGWQQGSYTEARNEAKLRSIFKVILFDCMKLMRLIWCVVVMVQKLTLQNVLICICKYR